MRLFLCAVLLATPFAYAQSQGMSSRQLSEQFSTAKKQRNEARMMRELKDQVAKKYGQKVAHDLTAFVRTEGSHGRACNDQKLITHVVGQDYVCEVFHVALTCDYENAFSTLMLEDCMSR